MAMMMAVIAVPLYRRSRPQGVSGACCGKASYYSGERERESHRTPSHLHRHPAQKIFIGRQNGKFLESFPSGSTIAWVYQFLARAMTNHVWFQNPNSCSRHENLSHGIKVLSSVLLLAHVTECDVLVRSWDFRYHKILETVLKKLFLKKSLRFGLRKFVTWKKSWRKYLVPKKPCSDFWVMSH